MAEYLADLTRRYPIFSIEDGMAEDDFVGWKALTDLVGDKVQLVGDDLFVTNPKRLKQGIADGLANSLLVKVNQIGTSTRGRWQAVSMAQRAGYTAAGMSHRSGETEVMSTIAGPRVVARPIAGRSRPAALPAPTGWRSIISSSGSRKNSTSRQSMPGGASFELDFGLC